MAPILSDPSRVIGGSTDQTPILSSRTKKPFLVSWYAPVIGITQKYHYVDSQPVPVLNSVPSRSSMTSSKTSSVTSSRHKATTDKDDCTAEIKKNGIVSSQRSWDYVDTSRRLDMRSKQTERPEWIRSQNIDSTSLGIRRIKAPEVKRDSDHLRKTRTNSGIGCDVGDDVIKDDKNNNRKRNGILESFENCRYPEESGAGDKGETRAQTLPRRKGNKKPLLFDENNIHKSSSDADINENCKATLRLNGYTNISQTSSPAHAYQTNSLKRYKQRRLSYTGSDIISQSDYTIPGCVPKSPSKGPIRMKVWCNEVNNPDSAVFRKLLSSSKSNKTKGVNLQYSNTNGTPGGKANVADEQFEERKQHWQQELEQLSEFLLQKSTQEQQEEGSSSPTDTAFIVDCNGLPVLRAVFDVKHFTPEEIRIQVQETEICIQAQHEDDREDRAYTKTLVRRMDLPPHCDPRHLEVSMTKAGDLQLEMPFHLPPQQKPTGPNVFRIVENSQGQRCIRISLPLGAEFTSDDITVEASGRRLLVQAGYDAEIGKYGHQRQERQFRQQFQLPSHVYVESCQSVLTPSGLLLIELQLRNEPPIRCNITTEDCSEDV